MEANTAAQPQAGAWYRRVPAWLLALVPLALIAGGLVAFAALNAPGVPKRAGPPAEELSVERTVLRPGRDRADRAQRRPRRRPDWPGLGQRCVRAVQMSDAQVGRLGADKLSIPYDWIEGQAYAVQLHTTTGGTIATDIPIAVETPTNRPELLRA
ncbi:MAG: hypothetical protein WKF40_12125 [Thermoleophilaceae bacterium]